MELKLRRCPICGNFPVLTLRENRNQASYQRGAISCECGHRVETSVSMCRPDSFALDIAGLVQQWDKRDTDDVLVLLQEAVKTISDDVLPYENDSFSSLKEQIQDRIEYLTETTVVQLEER